MSENLLTVSGLTHSFHLGRGQAIRAVDDFSLTLQKGEIFALVGESGCGKSTTARCLMNIYRPQAGQIIYRGVDTLERASRRRHRRMLATSRQMIFQDPAASLNPRMKVADLVAEPLKINHLRPERATLTEEIVCQLRRVGLDEELSGRYPGELSGGQKQRVAIARALITGPELLVADEPVTSLDVTVQAQIIALFRRLQKEEGFSMLFIAHDLALVSSFCDRVGVMYRGKLVETAAAAELFGDPRHPYTRSLLAAVPLPDPRRARARKFVPYRPQEGENEGPLTEVAPGHFVRKGARG